jgi:tagatose-6-phosphate ketose/aldose isomerase
MPQAKEDAAPPNSSATLVLSTMAEPGIHTHGEIFQQPGIWADTVGRVRASGVGGIVNPVLTGAGSSAYAAMAIEAAWPGSRAVPSTELLLDFPQYLGPEGVLISLARSGDSPESVALVEKIRRALPGVRHIALTANPQGRLATWQGIEAILLDPRTNDRSLVMTSSFSNLVMGGLALARPDEVASVLPALCGGWEARLEEHEAKARAIAQNPPPRAVVLASSPLFGVAREAALKVIESTAGRIAALAETYLGLRHGPMSFVQPDTLVLAILSSDPARRRYEIDLVKELRAKKLGRLIALGAADGEAGLFDEVVTTGASGLADYLRTPAEIVFPQLLAFHLGLRLGLNPDSPSPGGVIHRVVEGVIIYD